MDMVFKNFPQGIPLKFQGAPFGAIKIFTGKFFIGSLAGSGPEMTIIINVGRVFIPDASRVDIIYLRWLETKKFYLMSHSR